MIKRVKGLLMGRGLKTIVSLKVNSATMESDHTIAATASAYCRKMESISVYHLPQCRRGLLRQS